jgi:hypothetical protein
MRMKLFWIITCIVFPVITEGMNWVKVTGVDNFYLDVKSIKHVGPAQYAAWSKIEFKEYASIKEVRIHSLHHCVERKVRELQGILYYNDGTIHYEGARDWHYVIPNSNYEKILNLVCSYKKGLDI